MPLGSLLFDAPHSLRRQGEAAREMIVSDTNPDGWGAAWWDERTTPARGYRTATAIWEDDGFGDRAATSGSLLAAVRLASPGTTRDARNNAPFVAGAHAFSLNGFAFTSGREVRLRNALAPERRAALAGDTDTEVLFALARDQLTRGAGMSEALGTVADLVAPDADLRLNLLLGDGRTVAATAWGHTLYVLDTADAVTVASEPLDGDPRWARVPDRSLLEAEPGTVRVSPL